jgi:hypothetical protein
MFRRAKQLTNEWQHLLKGFIPNGLPMRAHSGKQSRLSDAEDNHNRIAD